MQDKKLEWSLLLLRISVFVVIFMWTIDKFINPEHAAKVYEKYYFLSGMGNTVMYIVGAIEMIILLMFLAGYKKTFSYGFVLLIHTVSTITPYKQYLSPFEPYHLLFFAAWPMLAACIALFLNREKDTLFAVKAN